MSAKERLDYLEDDIKAYPTGSEGARKLSSGNTSDPKTGSASLGTLDGLAPGQRQKQESRASLGALFANTYDIL